MELISFSRFLNFKQFEVMDHLMDVYKECFASNAMEMLRDQPYVLNVWLPEVCNCSIGMLN